ncbi:MAG TPA: LysM domain-containing protein [Chloroflexota bacterium]|nr:LysM domain-containing protein [Chloroflexota bacterium]
MLAAGLENIDLGLERLPPRRRRGPRRWLLLVGAGLGVAIYIALGGRLFGGDAAAPTAPVGAPPNHPTAVDLETLRAVAASAGALGTEPEMVPGPGGVLVRTKPVEPNYIVAPGDTLELIAQRFGTTVEALVGMNNLRDRHSLRVGQPLIIP